MVARLPGRGPRSASAIEEALHRLVRGESAPSFDEGLLPVVALAVAAFLDELAVLAVRHLVLVDEGFGNVAGSDVLQAHQRQPGHVAAGDGDHSGRHVAFAVEVHGELHPVRVVAPLPALRGDVAGF